MTKDNASLEVCSDEDIHRAVRRFQQSDVRVDGYRNRGNTCYINSVLQCLMKGTPLGLGLLQAKHHECREVCFVCYLRKLQSDTGGENVLGHICSNVRHVSKAFHRYTQEDAHEFYRYLLDLLNETYVRGFARGLSCELNDVRKEAVEQTTLPNKMFSGRLVSKITCLHSHTSVVKQPFLNMTVNLHPSVSDLFDLMLATTKPDTITDYECEGCKTKVSAMKAMLMDSPPRVLAIHLLRFAHTSRGAVKLSHLVKYPLHLDVEQMLHTPPDHTVTKYSLAALVLHKGNTATSGHYTCIVNQRGNWNYYNDSYVTRISMNQALGESPYMLFYLRDDVVPTESPQRIPCNVSLTPRRARTPQRSTGCIKPLMDSPQQRAIMQHGRENGTGQVKRKYEKADIEPSDKDSEQKRSRKKIQLFNNEAKERKITFREFERELNLLRELERRSQDEVKRRGQVQDLETHGALSKPLHSGVRVKTSNRAQQLNFSKRKPPPMDRSVPPLNQPQDFSSPIVTVFTFSFLPENVGSLAAASDGFEEEVAKALHAPKDAVEVRLFNKKLKNIESSKIPKMGLARVTYDTQGLGSREFCYGGETYKLQEMDVTHFDCFSKTAPNEEPQTIKEDIQGIIEAVSKMLPVGDCLLSQILQRVSKGAGYLIDKNEHPKQLVEMGQTFLNGCREKLCQSDLAEELKKIIYKSMSCRTVLYHSAVSGKEDNCIFDTDFKEL